MRRIATLAFVQILALTACVDGAPSPTADAGLDASTPDAGSDAGGLANPGFPVPTAVAKANAQSGGTWTETGDADWSCLRTPSADAPSTQTIMLSGQLFDFQSAEKVGSATLTAFPGAMLDGNLGVATSSDVAATRGDYTVALVQLPAGETRFGLKLEASAYLTTHVLNQYLDPALATQSRDFTLISASTAASLTALLRITRDATTGMVLGTFRDCAGREVANAVATVSSTSGTVTHLPGAATYYASLGGIPSRHDVQPSMNRNGSFLVFGLPPQRAPAYIQIWGFVNAADLAAGNLTLLSELPSPIEANTVTTGSFEPVRAD